MAIVAEVLAGATRARVTDRAAAYAAIANIPLVRQATTSPDQLVALTLSVIDTDKIPLKKLIDLRQREARGNGHELRALRHNYLATLASHAEHISRFKPGSPDRTEADRVFFERMAGDVYAIKRELGFAKKEALLSKDVIALVLAGAGLLAAGAAGVFSLPGVISGAGGAVTVGGLLNSGTRLAKSRRDILLKHPMAYLYEAS